MLLKQPVLTCIISVFSVVVLTAVDLVNPSLNVEREVNRGNVETVEGTGVEEGGMEADLSSLQRNWMLS